MWHPQTVEIFPLLRFQAKTYRSQWCHTWVHSCLCRVAKANGNTQNWLCFRRKTGHALWPVFRRWIYEFIYLFIYLSINLFIYLYIQVAIKTWSLPRHHNLRRWTLETRHPPMGQHGKGWQHLNSKSRQNLPEKKHGSLVVVCVVSTWKTFHLKIPFSCFVSFENFPPKKNDFCVMMVAFLWFQPPPFLNIKSYQPFPKSDTNLHTWCASTDCWDLPTSNKKWELWTFPGLHAFKVWQILPGTKLTKNWANWRILDPKNLHRRVCFPMKVPRKIWGNLQILSLPPPRENACATERTAWRSNAMTKCLAEFAGNGTPITWSITIVSGSVTPKKQTRSNSGKTKTGTKI